MAQHAKPKVAGHDERLDCHRSRRQPVNRVFVASEGVGTPGDEDLVFGYIHSVERRQLQS